jgi:hypothetical protein
MSISKFLNGFFVTVTNMAAVKMINETVPNHLLASAGATIMAFFAFGLMLCFGLGLNLPQADFQPGVTEDPEIISQYLNDTWWRFMYILPCFLNLFMVLSFQTLIKEDSIMFNLSHENDD